MSPFAYAVAYGLSDLERRALIQVMWGDQFDLLPLDRAQFEIALRQLLARFRVGSSDELKKFVHQAAKDEISNEARAIRTGRERRRRNAMGSQMVLTYAARVAAAAAVLGKIPVFLNDF